mmetsp:Transcript_32525/g.78746  ORF Transcript_32525/g.78746 Transcript_32525/m.78746 type:complete len:251 (-) Transcript_32525:91-843(-)
MDPWPPTIPRKDHRCLCRHRPSSPPPPPSSAPPPPRQLLRPMKAFQRPRWPGARPESNFRRTMMTLSSPLLRLWSDRAPFRRILCQRWQLHRCGLQQGQRRSVTRRMLPHGPPPPPTPRPLLSVSPHYRRPSFGVRSAWSKRLRPWQGCSSKFYHLTWPRSSLLPPPLLLPSPHWPADRLPRCRRCGRPSLLPWPSPPLRSAQRKLPFRPHAPTRRCHHPFVLLAPAHRPRHRSPLRRRRRHVCRSPPPP